MPNAPPETFAHTVTLRRDATGRWVVTHSWKVTGSRDWRHAVKHFTPRDQARALAWAERLRGAYAPAEALSRA